MAMRGMRVEQHHRVGALAPPAQAAMGIEPGCGTLAPWRPRPHPVAAELGTVLLRRRHQRLHVVRTQLRVLRSQLLQLAQQLVVDCCSLGLGLGLLHRPLCVLARAQGSGAPPATRCRRALLASSRCQAACRQPRARDWGRSAP